MIESEFGYYVKVEGKNKNIFTEKQKKEMSKFICNDPGVVKQLKDSLLESDEEYIEEEEEFIHLIREAQANE